MMMNMKQVKRCVLASTALTFALSGVFASTPAFAQSQQEASVEEIVVTGTRVVRDGYQAPTPLTVVGVEQLTNSTASNVADFVNTMPAFSGSRAPTNTNSSMSAGTSGLNAVNLRSLGLERTLVLIDGRRTVSSRPTGIVDVNTFPQTLISRVEIVTGGASAAYGADAVAGVVNFILDKEFTGIKGEASGGITTYGDNESWSFDITAGTPFANGRGHFLITGEVSRDAGVPTNDRPWNLDGWNIVHNPAYTPTGGLPEYLVRDQTSPSNGIVGGIITSTALEGNAFGEGGVVYPFPYGHIVDHPLMVGGGWQAAQIRGKEFANGLTSRQKTQSFFTRVSYDVTDDINAWVEASWSGNQNRNWCCMKEDTDSLTISIDNAFIPDSIRAQANALGITSFRMGSMNADIGRGGAYNERRVQRYTVGLDGSFDAFESGWDWNVYYQKGIAHAHQEVFGIPRRSRFAKALDSVIDASGQPACRVNTDADLSNDDPICVPYNIFGINVNSPATIDYLKGNGDRDYRLEAMKQDIIAGSISGEPFSTWAGPVSVAAGIEHRIDKVDGFADPISGQRDWLYGNYRVFKASQSVTEGFLETVVPLATDVEWAESLELNAAVRGTDYKTSGFVTTWKVGATYQPISDIRFRGTVSRDIRAPTLNDLFSSGGGGFPGIVNPFRNGETEITVGSTEGNPNLRPEKSDYVGFGVVLQPQFLPGFSTSVDYWDVDISDAIGNASSQEIIDFCFQGNQDFCEAITFGPTQTIDFLRTQPFNLTTLGARGIDIEASYQFPVDVFFASVPGVVGLQFQATHYISRFETNANGDTLQLVGQNRSDDPPNWRWRGSVDYRTDSFRANLTARGVSSGVYDNRWIECTSACPASTSAARTTENNQIAGAIYLDTAISYNFMVADTTEMELFLNVKNIANKAPPVVAPGPGGYSYEVSPANPQLYDVLGRTFRAGLRFKM